MIKSVENIPAFMAEFINDFGIESIFWRSDTIRKTLEEEWGYFPTDVERSKIFAAFTVVSDDKYRYDPDIFEKVVIGLSDNYVDFRVTQKPDLDELMKSLKIIQELRPDTTHYGYQVHAYIGAVCYDDDLYVVPRVKFGKLFNIDHVQESINNLMVEKQPALIEEVTRIFEENDLSEDLMENDNPLAYQVALILTLDEVIN